MSTLHNTDNLSTKQIALLVSLNLVISSLLWPPLAFPCYWYIFISLFPVYLPFPFFTLFVNVSLHKPSFSSLVWCPPPPHHVLTCPGEQSTKRNMRMWIYFCLCILISLGIFTDSHEKWQVIISFVHRCLHERTPYIPSSTSSILPPCTQEHKLEERLAC